MSESVCKFEKEDQVMSIEGMELCTSVTLYEYGVKLSSYVLLSFLEICDLTWV